MIQDSFQNLVQDLLGLLRDLDITVGNLLKLADLEALKANDRRSESGSIADGIRTLDWKSSKN